MPVWRSTSKLWIAADAKLIGGELTIVGQQVRIDDGRLDLLAIDARDRWW